MNSVFIFPPALLSSVLLLAGKATLLLTLAFIVRSMMRRASASGRHFLISTAVILVAFLPALTLIAPGWSVPAPVIIQSRIVSDQAPSAPPAMPAAAVHAGPLKDAAGEAKTNAPRPAAMRNTLLWLWLLGTIAAAGRVLMGMVGCARSRRRSAEPESHDIRCLAAAASRRIGLRGEIAVRLGDRTEAPYIGGLARPFLYLPYAVLSWPQERLMSVLLHELAHVKRRDHLLWPLVNLAVSWLWFNPLVWLALARMRREEERACDDHVLACGSNRTGYAQHLLEACLSLGAPAKPAPLCLQFARKNEVRERILYMLDRKTNHRPMRRAAQAALVMLLAAALVPLTGITGFSTAASSGDVSPAERGAVVAVLEAFFAELSGGSDFQTVREDFLTADYFDDPHLTLEKLDPAVWQPAFKNTVSCIAAGGAGAVDSVQSRITSLRREGNEIVVNLQLEVTGTCLDAKQAGRSADGTRMAVAGMAADAKPAIRRCHVVNSLSQPVRLRLEGGFWKVSRFDGGVTIMQMDTDNPHGPIFLVRIENIDERTTPFGARVFKVIPRGIVPDAHNALFALEE